ncbi:MAG: ABC transporter ATP-binding protein [Desulfuromonadales bacterium GWD2_61_12]|nr:MAG: ABC transporter ATP-binding protein [Desulfuromonadales bacterium GWC2_61_20]OGR36117.1 MAG: ABC transporter ATP-binding protein [Desulfuromonadales bacterium GWD2_61_12]HAD04892.1 ABC transporter ATP-binding protein [Desulfuromonas sp.]HBT83651.1 ABC transporter ATP-binding protein [Desulfuromonas sp.]
MIRLVEVRKIFNAGRPNAHAALDGVTLTIRRSAVTVLKGPSGSGKTTLLSLIGCMARPTSGRIHLHGLDTDWLAPGEESLEITSLPERFLTGIRRRAFGFVFQQFHLVRGLSALDNVMLPALPTGASRAAIAARGMALLERFRVAGRAGNLVEHLSGGEAQRVAIARALINDPAVIIADEPTAHLDSRLSAEFMEIIATLRSEGRTVVIASHDPLVYAAPGVDAVVVVRDGRIGESGSGRTP